MQWLWGDRLGNDPSWDSMVWLGVLCSWMMLCKVIRKNFWLRFSVQWDTFIQPDLHSKRILFPVILSTFFDSGIWGYHSEPVWLVGGVPYLQEWSRWLPLLAYEKLRTKFCPSSLDINYNSNTRTWIGPFNFFVYLLFGSVIEVVTSIEDIFCIDLDRESCAK